MLKKKCGLLLMAISLTVGSMTGCGSQTDVGNQMSGSEQETMSESEGTSEETTETPEESVEHRCGRRKHRYPGD